MTLTAVTVTATTPVDQQLGGIVVTVELITGTAQVAASDNYGQVISTGQRHTNPRGVATLQLQPNSEITNPVGTAYRVTCQGKVWIIAVPVGGGPYTVDQLVTAPPGPVVYGSASVGALNAEIARATGVEATLVPQSRQVLAGTGMTGGGTLTADRTLGIAAGGVGRLQIDPTWRGAPLVFDDRFASYADSALNGQAVPMSGQTWTTQGYDSTGSLNSANDAMVQGHAVVQGNGAVKGACYFTIDTGPTAHDYQMAEFSFGAGTTFGSAVGLLASSQGANNFGAVRSAHCVIGPSTWSIGVWPNGSLVILASGTFSTPLAVNQTYRAAMHRVGNTLTVDLPTADSVLGRTVIVTDPSIGGRSPVTNGGLWGRYAIFESYTNSGTFATDRLPSITRATAGRNAVNAAMNQNGGLAQFMPQGPPTAAGVADVGIPGVALTGVTTLAAVANIVYYWEFEQRAPWTLKSFPYEVTTAGAAGTKGWWVVVPIDGTCQPTTDAPIASPEVALDVTGAQAPAPVGGAVTLPAGRYAVAFSTNGGPTMRTFIGAPPIAQLAKTLGAAPFALYRYVARTYTSAIPSPMPTWTTVGRAAAPGYHFGLLEWS